MTPPWRSFSFLMSDSKHSPEQKQGSIDLVYALNDRPKPLIAFFAALQQLLSRLLHRVF